MRTYVHGRILLVGARVGKGRSHPIATTKHPMGLSKGGRAIAGERKQAFRCALGNRLWTSEGDAGSGKGCIKPIHGRTP